MTTLSQVGKLYTQMPPSALASLVMNAAVAGEFAEAEKIIAAVPRKTYTCPDVQYQWRRDAMETGLLALGVEYWHCVSMMMVANAAVFSHGYDEEASLPEVLAADTACQRWAAHHRALDATLAALCEYAALDERRIRSWLRIPAARGNQAALTDVEQAVVEERLAAWRKALEI
jgi:hypothetical protein